MATASCQSQQTAKDPGLLRIQAASEQHSSPKKVIFLLVDSLMAQAIDRGVRQHELPAFQYLIEHGQYYKNMVSTFPTMSVSIDSSLLTGHYPDEHHLPGLTWYPQNGSKVIGYGSAPLEVLRRGTRQVLNDTLVELNGRHLNPGLPTIYDDLHQRGLTSGSVNALMYRGPKENNLRLPMPLSELGALPKSLTVKGPDFLTFGALANPLEGTLSLPDGPTDQMGFNDRYAVETAKHLIRTKQLPDFLLVYLPELDGKVHRGGPADLRGIRETDRLLQELLQAYGSYEQALRETIFIVAGDNGMSQVLPKDRNPVIELPKLLKRYNILPTGGTVKPETEVALGVNDTMAYVYSLKPKISLTELADVLQAEQRIDMIVWQENGWITCVKGGSKATLRFKPGGSLADDYRQTWTVEGDDQVLDLKRKAVDSSHTKLMYGKYPDPLRRLQGALNSHEGRFVIATAKPGYELAEAGSPTHPGGGAHGGLDQSTSLVPLIICGTNDKPEFLRIVDLKPFLLNLLNPGERRPDGGKVTPKPVH
ncbi:alkaline phosphatase family protein [Paenibacillus macerans]|uniref:alkaline phosphatase family protein n=1 Tax=Paenibacillus macerans TaxID=44252 RepID=UPI003D3179E2